MYYLLKIIGDVEPELPGPFPNEAERDKKALKHRKNDPEMKDGLFSLDLEPAFLPIINVKSYSNAFFELSKTWQAKSVTIYEWPFSQKCLECNFGEELAKSSACICHLNSEKNDEGDCPDFEERKEN